MNDVTWFTQSARASFITFSTNFLRWENEEKTRRKRSIKFYETINFISRYSIKGREKKEDERQDERKNKRKKGSKKSSVNSNDFNAGKIWWQFHLTIITTTRPHMSRCIRVTRNTLLYSLQRFHVIYRGSETCIHRLLRISTTVSRIVSCLSLCLRSYTPPRNRPVCFFNAFFPTEINLTRFLARFYFEI